MNSEEIKGILDFLRSKGYDSYKLKVLENFLSEKDNENILKQALEEDLKNFEVDESKAGKVDFQSMFQKIKTQLPAEPHFETQQKVVSVKKRITFSYVARMAASFLLIFVSGILFYHFLSGLRDSHPEYTTIKAPLGAKSEIILPDGSVVWLNAGSELKYQNFFNKKNRSLELKGEGYFKVAQDKTLPFAVTAGDLTIVATGTEFNVKAYDDEETIETTLVEGQVIISKHSVNTDNEQQVYLEPRQKAIYIKNRKQLTIKDIFPTGKPDIKEIEKGSVYIEAKVDPVPIVSWKDNKLIFKGEKLSSLTKKLERKYNIRFTFDSSEIRQYRFSGTLEDETLTQVMDVIKLSAPIDYKLVGKEVFIHKDESRTQKFNPYLKGK